LIRACLAKIKCSWATSSLALPFFQFESFYSWPFWARPSKHNSRCGYQKKAPFQYSASIFIAHTWNSIYQIKRNIIKILLNILLPPNYALGSSSSNHPQRTIESHAKAVNFTFDNSNIRWSDKSSGLASSVISGFHPPHNFHKRNQLEN
jgi:hypothetical protein